MKRKLINVLVGVQFIFIILLLLYAFDKQTVGLTYKIEAFKNLERAENLDKAIEKLENKIDSLNIVVKDYESLMVENNSK